MTGGQITIEWGNLERMFAAMNKVGDQAYEIDTYFNERVCNASGFDYDTCAMKPIGDMLPTLGGWFTDMRQVFDGRWDGVGDAIHNTVRQIDLRDGDIGHVFTHYRGSGIPSHLRPPPIDVDIELFEIADLGDSLGEPEEGDERQNHNNAFDGAAATWDTARDTINEGVDLINGLGIGLNIDRLSEKSLRDYIVFPLSANYARIQENASACRIVDGAMRAWGMNFTQLSGKVELGLQGHAGLALHAQLNLYHAVMATVGFGIGKGSAVFDQIAVVSEKIAVEVEDVLVILGKKLGKLSSKIASRFVPGLGWFLLALDIVKTKGAVIQDIIDDIAQCKQIIDDCFALVDEIKAWAETQAERLDKFQEVLDAVQKLPMVGEMKALEDLPASMDDIEASLDKVKDFGDEAGQAKDELDGALEDMGSQEYEDLPDSAPEQYEEGDDMLMAPGPLEGTYPGGSSGEPQVTA
ncbi:hypothetical protein [Nocardioides lijunqiniae]|uniref:hypothetical protein n=1 Tax=Nocardioides lijunqiniae TaxID=2760832 RepID=UPI0018784D34|nr:hypothetical protein [Nocardioides lijunqiniae]